MKLAVAACAAMIAATPSVLGGANLDPTVLGIGFICGAEDTPGAAGGSATGVMRAGFGNARIAVDGATPEAEAWFNQAMNQYHAFAHDESKAAFARAAAADPTCSLCASGVALSLGATLNTGMTPADRAAALAEAQRAVRLARPGDARARALAEALTVRYAETEPKGGREMAFAAALEPYLKAAPDDDMIANLAAHAMLIPARQENYAGVEPAIALIEGVLAKKPDDTAAIHYYIHATEFAGRAPRALAYAERLADLAPGSGHLVHMGTHTLMRVGDYDEVALRNARALKVDVETQPLLPTSGSLAQRYYLHNYLFGLGGALMAGDDALALKYADHAEKAFPADAPERSRVISRARSLVALARYAPERALAVPAGKDDPRALAIYRHYARGEAYAARRNVRAIRREAAAIAALAKAGPLNDYGREMEIAEIAEQVLLGRAEMAAGRPDAAAPHFQRAAAAQEKAYPVIRFFDPPPWWYPVRRSLAAAHLKAGRLDDAAREARASLVEWPHDGLALRILAEADRAGAAAHRDAARRAYRGDPWKAPLEIL